MGREHCYRDEAQYLGRMPGRRLHIGDHFAHAFLQPFLPRNLDELVQQTPTHPAVARGRVHDHSDFPDMLACSRAAVVQGAIADDCTVQECEQWQDPAVVQGLDPPGNNGGVGHIFLQIKTVLWRHAAEKVQQSILIFR
jgi:hypothetical protein